jgi:hypothetical protein
VSDERTTGSLFMTDTIVRNNSQSAVVLLQTAQEADLQLVRIGA